MHGEDPTRKATRSNDSESSIVRFSEATRSIRSKPISAEEAADYWYDPREIKDMMQAAESVAKLQADGKQYYMDETEYPTRGLELFREMPNGDSAKQSRLAVYEEQLKLRRVRHEGNRIRSKVQWRIQRACATFAHPSSIQARLLAVCDEVAAGRITGSTASIMLRLRC